MSSYCEAAEAENTTSVICFRVCVVNETCLSNSFTQRHTEYAGFILK